ncbi:MAG: deoxyribodipyrimidine photo-lyase, partial [Pseudomonadales bacterium]
MRDIAIHWFRQDLRLSDNPALTAASQHEGVFP